MITFDYGRGEGGKKCQNIDYVICERPLITYCFYVRYNHGIPSYHSYIILSTSFACQKRCSAFFPNWSHFQFQEISNLLDGRCPSFDSSPLSLRATSPGGNFSAVIWSAGGEPRITILHYINICITINISQVTGGLAPALTCLDTVRDRIGTQPLIKLKQSAWDVAVSKFQKQSAENPYALHV